MMYFLYLSLLGYIDLCVCINMGERKRKKERERQREKRAGEWKRGDGWGGEEGECALTFNVALALHATLQGHADRILAQVLPA